MFNIESALHINKKSISGLGTFLTWPSYKKKSFLNRKESNSMHIACHIKLLPSFLVQ